MTNVDDEQGMVRLRWLITVVLLCGLVACAGRGGSGPADPVLAEPGAGTGDGLADGGFVGGGTTSTTADVDGLPDHVPPPDPALVPVTAQPTGSGGRVALLGYGEVAVEIVRADGTSETFCLLLAELPAQTARGLMELTDPSLGGYDGMLFRFAEDHGPSGFYMRNVPVDLALAYFDGAGAFVSASDLAPCADVDGCPSDTAAGQFRSVIEVPAGAGGVAALGIGPGAVLRDLHTTCTV